MKSILFSFFLCVCFVSFGQKVDDRIIEHLDRNDSAPVLIQMRNQADLSDISPKLTKEEKGALVYSRLKTTAERTQQRLVEHLSNHKIKYKSFSIINALSLTITAEQLNALRDFKEIEKIIFDPVVSLEEPTYEYQSAQRMVDTTWGIKMIRADKVWEMGFRGEGVVIGGQDTGYDWLVSPLMQKYRGFLSDSLGDHNYNWHDAITEISPLANDSINNCGLNLMEPCDDHSHGTHTMGTMVGEDDENSIGIAPGAKWIGCRNMEEGNGSPSTYIECFDWFLAPTDLNGENPRPDLAPHVINNSWSCPESEGCNSDNWHIMEMVVNNIRAAGIVPVVSAGNSGGNGCGSVASPPAIFEGAFSVGATADNDTIANFSSRGPVTVDSSFNLKPNVSAPGRAVRSVVPGGTFANFSGTSMAGPHVAGLVALIINAYPDLAGQVDVIEDIIESTAVAKTSDEDCFDFLGQNVPNSTYGHGRIDAQAAVERALALSSTEDLLTNLNIKIFPNPTSGLLTIESSEKEISIIEVNDIHGKKLMSAQFNSKERSMDISDFDSGVYFITIYGNDFRISKKIVKL